MENPTQPGASIQDRLMAYLDPSEAIEEPATEPAKTEEEPVIEPTKQKRPKSNSPTQKAMKRKTQSRSSLYPM